MPGQKILVVDDELRVVLLFTDVLVEQGYEVIKASNATEGMMLFLEDPEIELVITDLQMPPWMEFGRQMLSQRPGTKMILVTGLDGSREVVEQALLEVGFQTVLIKPVDIEILIGAVKRVLEAP